MKHYRFEGISDPDDMSVVYAIESGDGTRGIIGDAFGVYANPELGGFLNNVAIQEGSWLVRFGDIVSLFFRTPRGRMPSKTQVHLVASTWNRSPVRHTLLQPPNGVTPCLADNASMGS